MRLIDLHPNASPEDIIAAVDNNWSPESIGELLADMIAWSRLLEADVRRLNRRIVCQLDDDDCEFFRKLFERFQAEKETPCDDATS